MALYTVMLNVYLSVIYAECRYAECCYGAGRGAMSRNIRQALTNCQGQTVELFCPIVGNKENKVQHE